MHDSRYPCQQLLRQQKDQMCGSRKEGTMKGMIRTGCIQVAAQEALQPTLLPACETRAIFSAYPLMTSYTLLCGGAAKLRRRMAYTQMARCAIRTLVAGQCEIMPNFGYSELIRLIVTCVVFERFAYTLYASQHTRDGLPRLRISINATI